MAPFSFRAPRSAALRAWHWLDAAAISGLLATVLLRKTWLSWRANAALITDRLAEQGTAITPELAREIALSMRAPMWEWHYRLGILLAFLVAARVLVAAWFPEERPFAAAYRAALAARAGGSLHVAAVRAFYAAFYLALTFMVVSGLLMYFHEALGIGEAVEDTLKELHEWTMWSFAAFAAIHVGGVVVAELTGEAGLVSDMIHGGHRP